MARWNPKNWHEFGGWLRNDADKIRSKPGLMAMTERVELAADIYDAVYAVHAGCQVAVCPTRQAIERVMNGEVSQ